jgi:hypothetical protein
VATIGKLRREVQQLRDEVAELRRDLADVCRDVTALREPGAAGPQVTPTPAAAVPAKKAVPVPPRKSTGN